MLTMYDIGMDKDEELSNDGMVKLQKAILSGKIISGGVWRFVYYNDILNYIDRRGDLGAAGRWSYPVDVIFELNGKDFCFTYYEGLTEYQESDFLDMAAIPVHKVTKTIVVEEWERIDN